MTFVGLMMREETIESFSIDDWLTQASNREAFLFRSGSLVLLASFVSVGYCICYPSYLVDGRVDLVWFLISAFTLLCSVAFLHLSQEAKKRAKNPRLHRLCEKLKSFGDLETVIKKIESEVDESGHRFKDYIFTASHLIEYRGVDIHKLTDLMWIYGRATKNSVNFIPTGTDYRVVLKLRDGSVREFLEPSDTVDAVLLILAEWAASTKEWEPGNLHRPSSHRMYLGDGPPNTAG